MRIGTAGILLNYACPAKIVEDFRILELFFSGRIDLGVVGGTILHDELYLDGRPRPDTQSYATRVRALVDLVRSEALGPAISTHPSLWLCGASASSGMLAGALGMQFACRQANESVDTARVAISAYRDAYRGLGVPYAAIAAYGTCAATESAARQLWPTSSPSPSFVGTPEICVDQLDALLSESGADEGVVHLHINDIHARLAGYELLAAAAGLAIECQDHVDDEL